MYIVEDSNIVTPKLEDITRQFLNNDDKADSISRFPATLPATAQSLSEWLLSGTNLASFSISYFLRSHGLGKLLEKTLGQDVNTKLRLLVYITNNLVYEPKETGYNEYSSQEIQEIGNALGSTILKALEPRLRPACLEQAKSKLENLYALFIAMLSLSITARYNFLHVGTPNQSLRVVR
jgi:hypothetical protein